MSALDVQTPADPNLKTYTLKPEDELRIECNPDNKLTLTLITGTAEVYGAELMVDKPYLFTQGQKLAVYTWHGCTVSVHGQSDSIYTSNESPMTMYINTHAALHHLRQKAADTIRIPGVYALQGPRALIVGANDSGKSTLCKILLNYAVRQSHSPLYIDLDPANNLISIPGSIACTVVDQPLAIDIADQPLQIKQPLCYFYGHVSTATATDIYDKQIVAMASVVNERCNTIDQSRVSGCIIKMSPNIERGSSGADSTKKSGYDLIIHTANAFNIDCIVVLGNERLYNELKSDTSIKRSSVIKVNKSGGVVIRTDKHRVAQRNRIIKHYFYGLTNELAPHTSVLHWREIEIYRLGGGYQAPTSALPIGGKRLIDPNKLTRIYPSAELLHSVMAVSQSGAVDELVNTNVAGYVYCSSVDMTKKTITLLTPAPGPLPSKYLLYGTVKWLDTT